MHLKKIKEFSFSLSSLFCLLCSVFFLSGCVTSEDMGRIQWEISDIRAEVRAIKKKTETIETGLPEVQGLGGLEESQKATERSVADMFMRTQELSKDIQLLTGSMEEMQYAAENRLKDYVAFKEQTASKIQKINILVEDIEKRLAQIELSRVAVEESRKKESEEAEKREEKTAKPGMKDAYMAAYESYKAGRSKEARDSFTAFLENYPENEYSDNARFWIAESYYKDENYEDAILAYEELRRKNPDSDKIPGAMLKQGLAFFALKDIKTGSLMLELLLDKFPDSEQAKTAKRKLAESTPAKKE